jgi:hypothetical protein
MSIKKKHDPPKDFNSGLNFKVLDCLAAKEPFGTPPAPFHVPTMGRKVSVRGVIPGSPERGEKIGRNDE